MNDKLETQVIGTIINNPRTFRSNGKDNSAARVEVIQSYGDKVFKHYLEVIKWGSTELSGYRKGQRLSAEGRIKADKPWEGNDGWKTGLTLNANRVELLPDMVEDTRLPAADYYKAPPPDKPEDDDLPF